MYHPAGMRRAGPILILLIGVLALLICFFPGLTLPDSTSATGSRVVETKLGLDLSGGLRVEYQAQPVEGKTPSPADMAIIKDIVERRAPPSAVFVDDLAGHHSSVAKYAPEVWRLHMVAEPRLAAAVPPAEDAHARIDDWPAACEWILDKLKGTQ